jgi:hypothetical protein
MSAPPPASSWAAPPEFYIDENMAGRSVRRALEDLGYRVHTPPSVFGGVRLAEGLSDEDWLPVVGSKGWVVFCRDQRILDRPAELTAYLNARVHMFLLPGSATLAEILELLQTNLAEICALATARRPNVYWLERRRVVPYERRVAALDRKRR